MTNETIRPGDLVMVVRPTPCCAGTRSIGKIFSVKAIRNGKGRCSQCKLELGIVQIADFENGKAGNLSTLKKLNPPAKQETTEKEKEMA